MVPGHAAWTAEQNKVEKYKDECARQQLQFVPVVAETFWGLGKAAVSVLDHLMRGVGDREDCCKRTARAAVYYRLSVAIQTHCAWMIRMRARQHDLN